MNYLAYCTALQEQFAIHRQLLDQLGELQRPLNLLERTAAERSMQILVEALIGSAKHLNKKAGLTTRNDAYQAVAQASEHYQIKQHQLAELRGAVGMRNAIVHDYLNLDWEAIAQVIDDRKYHLIGEFVDAACTVLLTTEQ